MIESDYMHDSVVFRLHINTQYPHEVKVASVMVELWHCISPFFSSIESGTLFVMQSTYRIFSNFGTPSFWDYKICKIYNLATPVLKFVFFFGKLYIEYCCFCNIHLFSKPNQVIIDTKFAILRLYFMVPSQKLVLAPDALFRGNTVHWNFIRFWAGMKRSTIQDSVRPI